MAERFQNLIDGKWVDAANGAVFDDINPANKTDVLGEFPRSDHRDVDRAVEAAKSHFPAWRQMPASRRARILFRASQILESRGEELARLITRETGKVLKESQGDVQKAVDMLCCIAGEGGRLQRESMPSQFPDTFATVVRVPLGVVAAITPYSFPLATPIWQLAPAIMSGNSVIYKPAEDAPLTATRLVEILLEAGLPPGVINLLQGQGEEAGAPVVRHPEVALVCFTGSTEVGREVAIACAADHKRVSLMLGGKNSILVMEDADLDMATDGTIQGAFGLSGQRCTATSRVLVHKKVMREFMDRLVTKTQALRLGDGMSPSTDVGPLINDAQLKRVHGYTRVALKEGAKLLCGGEAYREGECKKGFFYAPTVFGEVTPKMRVAQEQLFGPSLALLSVSSLEEAVEIANTSRYALLSAVYTRDITRAFRAIDLLKARITSVNGSTLDADLHLPLGGMYQTGGGIREGSLQILDVFTEWKTVTVDYSGKFLRPQSDTKS